MPKASFNTRIVGTERCARGGRKCASRIVFLFPVLFFVTNCDKKEEATQNNRTLTDALPHESINKQVHHVIHPHPYDTYTRLPDEISTELKTNSQYPLANEECCSNPGAISNCWWQDAYRDGVTCKNDNQCISGNVCDKSVRIDGKKPPNGWGLCECNDDSDCRDGICTLEGRCGPSFCNGFLVCSCWGGCQEANTGTYRDHNEMCQAVEDGYPGNCCEGKYPSDVEGNVTGFCSNSCVDAGGTVCKTDVDCNDANPCTIDSCDKTNHCAYDPISWGAPTIANHCSPPLNTRSPECIKEWCQTGQCIWRPDNKDHLCEENILGIDSSWHGGNIDHVRANEGSDPSSCFFGSCDDQGQCQAAPLRADGLICDKDDENPCTDSICESGFCVSDVGDTRNRYEDKMCDADGDACLVERCKSGVCTLVNDKPCDDGNFCTGPDTCEDRDSKHLDFVCGNPHQEEGSNAEDYGYVDTDPCVDVICRSGIETPEEMTCTPPEDLHLTCNRYECDPEGEEDNCNALPINDGQPCDDNNGCTLSEVCVSGFCGDENTARKICDDKNPCTTDTCIDDPAGTCRYDGAPHNKEACNDNDKCTGAEAKIPVNDICVDGICTAGATRNCEADEYNQMCHKGKCDAETGSCFAEIQEGDDCNDGNPCTLSDTCDASGDCVGTPKTCPTEKPCHTAVCDTDTGECGLEPVENGTPCIATDGTGECSPNDTCKDGICEPDLENLITCPGDVCNTSYCDPDDGLCKYSNESNLNLDCEGVLDNDSCTLDQCTGAGAESKLTCTRVKENDISSWYDTDNIVGTLTIDGDPANADTLTDPILGDAKGYLLSGDTGDGENLYRGEATGTRGWKGLDHIWTINYTGENPAKLHFSGCLYGGEGNYDGQMHLFDCARSSIAEDNDSCESSYMPTFSVTLIPGETYFFLMDGKKNGDNGAYSIAVYYDTCNDGILNGDEILIDSGGKTCCGNHEQNGNEVAVDRGGSCCNDGIQNGDETNEDCGGAYCDPCDPCTNGILDDGEWEVDCGGVCPAVCTTNADCETGYACNTEIEKCGICLPLLCSEASDSHLTDLGHLDQIELPMSEGCADVVVGGQDDLNYTHHGDRYLKFQIADKASGSGSCDFTSPNYTYTYTTEYCLTWHGTSSIPYDDPNSTHDFIGCPQWEYTTGSGRVSRLYDQLLIPVMQYTRRVRLSFIDNGDNCILKSSIYWQ